MPFEQHTLLAARKWADFTEMALHDDKIYVFECCFIQNPLTIGMIKWGKKDERLIEYVLGLEKIIHKLNPVLLYVQQDDLEGSFRKAFDEKPADWADGFVEYYTNQGYGEKHQHTGINGTLEVLKERKKLEMNFYERLSIQKSMINNSLYDLPSSRAHIIDKLTSFHVI